MVNSTLRHFDQERAKMTMAHCANDKMTIFQHNNRMIKGKIYVENNYNVIP